MKRYIKSNIAYEPVPVYQVDFYRMISDAIPQRAIYIAEDDYSYALDVAIRLAKAWGYNPDKMIIQETGKTAEWFFNNPNMQYFNDIWYLPAG